MRVGNFQRSYGRYLQRMKYESVGGRSHEYTEVRGSRIYTVHISVCTVPNLRTYMYTRTFKQFHGNFVAIKRGENNNT